MSIEKTKTPIQRINDHLYIKREDLLAFSFGGNKARKAKLFMEVFNKGKYDCIVTYGSSSSNHCRIVSNLCAARSIPCFIIAPEEASMPTFNSQLMRLFGAEITTVPVDKVSETIKSKIAQLKGIGRIPFFIPGGGHGNLGTQAYVNCYEEIRQYEIEQGLHFDYIFHASGTGTTQAGLVCGQLIHKDNRKIIGISIARNNPRGRDIIIDSIHEYCEGNKVCAEETDIQKNTIFIDDYTGVGYGKKNKEVLKTIWDVMKRYGIPMDSIYTGKAFWGMQEYLKKQQISGKNILFIHTGGTPLFFDDLEKIRLSTNS